MPGGDGRRDWLSGFFWCLKDGERGIEWVYPGFRFGLVADPNPEDSSWFLVTDQRYGSLAMSGYLGDGRQSNEGC
jgi:hypothetical protein